MLTTPRAPRPSRCPRCLRCRQRKIKCDYVSSGCGPCAKARVTCEPYKREYLFIKSESPLRKESQETRVPPLQQRPWRVQTSTQRDFSTHLQQPQQNAQQSACSAASAVDGTSLECVIYESQKDRLPTVRELTRSPMLIQGPFARATLFDHFLCYYLPGGTRLRAQPSSQAWLATVRSNLDALPALEASACALGALTLGRGLHDTAMQRRSFGLYGYSLSSARKLIATTDPKNANWLRVLETINLLSLFETLAPQFRLQKTLNHVAGLSILLQMAGAASFQDPEAHNIFIHARSAIVYTAVLEEKATFLAEPSWLKEPWIHIMKPNSSVILDVIALIPAVLGLTRTIQSAVESDDEYRYLLDDFDTLSLRICNMLTERSTLLSYAPNNDQFCGVVSDFAAVQLYHSCELFRYDALQRIARHALRLPVPFARYVCEVARLKPQMEAYARGIISDIQKFETEDCGFITANMLFLPLLIANKFLQHNNSDDEDVMGACRHVMKTFIDRGFHFLRSYT